MRKNRCALFVLVLRSSGLIDADGVLRDLSAHIADIDGATLNDAGLDQLRALDPASLPAVDDRRGGACVGGVGKFICIGLNFHDHARETGLQSQSIDRFYESNIVNQRAG